MLLPALRKACVWFGPTIVFFVVLELAARHHLADEIEPLRPDPVLNHVWIPSTTVPQAAFADRGVPPYVRTINAQGWPTSGEFTPHKQPGEYRIAYLGDSFTEGTVPEEQTVPAIVGRNLTVSGYTSRQVINTGTPSYAPTLYYLLLKTRLVEYQPDLIVVNVDMTDVFDDSLYRATLSYNEQGEPIACPPGHPLLATHRRTEAGLEPLSPLQRAVVWLADRSAALRMVFKAIAKQQRNAQVHGAHEVTEAFAWCGFERSERTLDDIRHSMKMLRLLIQFAKNKGITVAITAVPHLQQLEGSWSLEPMNEIAAVCKEENVPFLNPVEAFKQKLGTTPPREIYIPNDMHFNATGYRLWAEIQVEFLRGLIGE